MSDYETSDTGNWNTAENWSNLMIFKPFYDASQYLTIAKFGCSDIEEDFQFDEQTKIISRLKALRWSKDKIEMGIRQCLFAIRNQNDKNKIKEYLKDMEEMDNYFPLIEERNIDRDKIKIQINEENFNIVYKFLLKVYTEITEPMNKSDLIFNYREQFDPKKAKKRIKEDFITTG